MPYATENDLTARLGADLAVLLADEDADGAPDSAILAAALADAQAEIDTALASRYATPVSPAPALLTRLNVDLAVYFLFIRRREAISPEHLTRWREAREQLDQFARGELALEGAEPRLAGFKTDSTTREQQRRFDRDALDSY
jgi:phage gp36-like protein